MGVKDRQGMKQHITGREAPGFHQCFGVGEQVALGEHGTLGSTGCA